MIKKNPHNATDRYLTSRQQAFANEYVVDLNATKAAIRAGYAEKHAGKWGPALLGKSRIREAIDRRKRERSARTAITADTILLRLWEMFSADVAEILDDERQSFKPIKEWPIVWRRMLQGCEVKELYEGVGGDRERIGDLVKSRFVDRLKVVELLGKHIGVKAFEEAAQHHTNNILVNKIEVQLVSAGNAKGLPAGVGGDTVPAVEIQGDLRRPS